MRGVFDLVFYAPRDSGATSAVEGALNLASTADRELFFPEF